jgi:hexulose-6-phosphate isomerase
MINPIGIVQGRLSTPVKGAIQAFPKDNWREEFPIASNIGLNAIEIIYDGPRNPLAKIDTANEIINLAQDNNIEICSVSADYSMYYPLYGKTAASSLKNIIKIVNICGQMGIPRVGLSFEDNSAILYKDQAAQAISNVIKIAEVANIYNIVLTIETSLSPTNTMEFISRVGYEKLKVNFDTGNSIANGENPKETILELNNNIGGIHIKDRKYLFGSTVTLGTGDVNFRDCFEAINQIEYDGTIVIQGARGENDIETAKNYLKFIRMQMARI